MFWLADVLVGSRGGRERRSEELGRDVYHYQRLAREARAEAFDRAFAWIGRVIGSGARSGLEGLASLVRKYRQGRAKGLTIRQLNALSDHVLTDIGVARGEIPAVAEALANGTLVQRGRVHGVASRGSRRTQRAATSPATEWRQAA